MASFRGGSPIPQYLGLPQPIDVLPSFAVRLAFFIFGLLWFRDDGSGASIMSLPLLIMLPDLITKGVYQYRFERAFDPTARELNCLNFGPLLVHFRPLRVKVSTQVPAEALAGMISFKRTGNYPGFEAIQQSLRRSSTTSTVTAVILLLATSVSLFWFRSCLLASFLAIGAYSALASGLTFRAAINRLAIATDSDHLHLEKQAQFMPLCQANSLTSLSDYEIEELERIPIESALGLPSLLFAYLARINKGQRKEAAATIVRAVDLAGRFRRDRAVLQPAVTNQIYLEAAFVSAAYAADLDFAMRAVAVGGATYIDSSPYHRAMTAIWIRLGNRAEALKSYALARHEASWWFPDASPVGDLDDLAGVFRTNDIRPLQNFGIDPTSFRDLDRPIFGRPPGVNGVTKYTNLVFDTVTLSLTFTFARYSELPASNSHTVTMLVSIVLLCFMYWLCAFRRGLARAVCEITGEGLLLRAGYVGFWYPWNVITKVDWMENSQKLKALWAQADESQSKARKEKKPIRLTISDYSDIWPTQTMEQAISEKAPWHLFSGAIAD